MSKGLPHSLVKDSASPNFGRMYTSMFKLTLAVQDLCYRVTIVLSYRMRNAFQLTQSLRIVHALNSRDDCTSEGFACASANRHCLNWLLSTSLHVMQEAEEAFEGNEMTMEMLEKLQQLPWRRIDADFSATSMPFFAHNLIQVMNPN